MSKNAICTIASINYYAHVLGLYDTVKRYHSDIDFYVLIVDKTDDKAVINNIKQHSEGLSFIFVEDICVPGFSEMVKKYNVVELNTAVKPFF